MPVFAVAAVDTLGAGDTFHGGFALALAEGRDEVGGHAVRRRRRRRSNARGLAAFPARRGAPRWMPCWAGTPLEIE